MTLRKKIIAAVIALAVGMSAAVPTIARADEDDWHREGHQEWNRDHDRDRDRDGDRNWSYSDPGYRSYPNYANRRGYIAPNGEGMINRRNPNFYWACDSEGHHCHWARRF
jgi:Ni/Co efflux regulator RcnB